MESFDNFQYDSGSSYGGVTGMGIVDDNSSVYTSTTTNDKSTLDLDSLSISGSTNGASAHKHSHSSRGGAAAAAAAVLDEDFENVLDDLKDEGAADLPPHACR